MKRNKDYRHNKDDKFSGDDRKSKLSMKRAINKRNDRIKENINE
jgi:hypothetical protein